MTPHPAPGAVFVETPARLHFGMLDLTGSLGRRFGGLGAAIPAPSLLLEAERADGGIHADGPEQERVRRYAERVLARWKLPGGVRFTVHHAIPAHAGLGSGTQLGLAVARAIAELFERPADAVALARASGRGLRSGIGMHAFVHGGFLLEGGREDGSDRLAPLLARHPMPPDWRYILALPDADPGLSGEAEVEAFRHLPVPPVAEAERVAHLVLMRLLPGVVEGDLASFGAALTEVQRLTGSWFAPRQGGTFADGPTARLVARLQALGVPGVGQSSWGPAVYGIVEGDAAAHAVVSELRLEPGAGRVVAGRFSEQGARVWRAPVTAVAAP